MTRERDRYLLHEHTREALPGDPATLLVLPTGATEQHGPHLPIGTNSLVVERLANIAAEVARHQIPIVVAPVLPFGSSAHHLPFGATMSLSSETYLRVMNELLDSVAASGFRRVFILNGHGGNHELMQVAARDAALKHDITVAAGSYWSIAWEALIDAGAGKIGRLPGHAGAFETSLMLSLHPMLVSEVRPGHRATDTTTSRRAYDRGLRTEHHGSWVAMDGYSDGSEEASAELGQEYLDLIGSAIAEAFMATVRGAEAAGH